MQVKKGYYKNSSYNSLERFISYYYQIDSILSLGIKNILEIGIGSNLVSFCLKEYGINVMTCDFDSSVEPDIVADIRKIPLPDKSFDAVLACQVLEHIPFEDFDNALIEIKRLSSRYVVISLPYRSVFFESVLKFPFIRKIFNRSFFDFVVRKAVKFQGFKSSGQHYWEIDSKMYKMKIVRDRIKNHFKIIKEFSPVLNKYHYFFILEN